MALPYSYYFIFPPKDKHIRFRSKETIKSLLHSYFLSLTKDKNHDNEFKIPSPFIGILFRFQFDILSENPLKIGITVFLQNLINISLIFTMIAALFSTFNFVEYFLFSLIIISLFFWLNIIIFIRYLKKQIINSLSIQPFFEKNLGSEENLAEQDLWINDPGRCPACGTAITEKDLFCPECELRLKQNRFTKKLNTEKYHQYSPKNIIYHYTKKNDQKR